MGHNRPMNEENDQIRADSFKKARTKRCNEIAEDYTEMIAELQELNEDVRVCDLAKRMGVSHVNVIKTIKKLIRDGFLLDKPEIQLTARGKKMASFSKRKHLILSQFFHKLGVPEEVLAGDVEGIEHHISEETLEAIERHLKTLN